MKMLENNYIKINLVFSLERAEESFLYQWQ
jgi:hypothetical protein